MAPRLRHMRAYRPRKRTKGASLHKQALHDLKHKISSNVGAMLVLHEEGDNSQFSLAQARAKSEFLKHRSEMEKIASTMGDRYMKAVRDYLNSVDTLLHVDPNWIDQEKIRTCYQMTERLEKELQIA
ncbi:MAG: hypothetical protein JSS61_05005 [Verrucomicrobia bacterium]|nr:hypothetical protein [Verrucomicrobiota bacterium]